MIRHHTIEDTGKGQQTIGMRMGSQARTVVVQDNTIKATTRVQDDRPAAGR